MNKQVPIPDQLAVIRMKLVALKAEEAALRDILLADPSARAGGDYIAKVRDIVQYRVKAGDLEKADPDLFAKVATERVVTQIVLLRRMVE